MSKPSYEDLYAILLRVWKTSQVESVLGIEWANYPIEVFNEVIDVITELGRSSEQ